MASNRIYLDEKYSTTRVVAHEKKEMTNNGDDLFDTQLFLSKNKSRIGEGGLRTQGNFKASSKNKPLVTIITVVFNGASYLEDTIKSVMNQTYDNVEYIIIDGGSTDGTLGIIKKYENQIDYWVSEADSGIYNAWNKGLTLVSGDIIGFLNADDYYDLRTIESIVPFFIDNRYQITYGNTQFLRNELCIGFNNSLFNPEKIYNGFGFMHTTVFTSINIYKKIGLFNESFRIAGDTDWLIRAYKEDVTFKKLDNLTYMRDGGISDKFESQGFNEFTSSLIHNGFNSNKIRVAKLRNFMIRLLNKILGKEKKSYIKQQLNFMILKMFNIVYELIPFFILKKRLLQMFSINIGSSSYLHTPVKFFSRGNIEIGDNSTINPNSYLDNRGLIRIGTNVSIAHNAKIYTAGHDINSPCFNYKVDSVVIEDNVVIFSNVLIMPGVKIKKGAVVFPGSVVSKDVEENSVVGGNPANLIKFRDCKDIKYKIDYSYWFAQ